MTASPIALLILGGFVYVLVVVAGLFVAGLLALIPSTRAWGRRLAYAIIGTAPPVVAGVFSVTVLFALASMTLGVMGQGASANEGLAAKAFLLATVFVAGCGAIAGWRIGWAMGGGIGFSDAIQRDAVMRLLGLGRRGA